MFPKHVVFQFVPAVKLLAAQVALHVVIALTLLAVPHHGLLVLVAQPTVAANGG